MNTLSGVLFFAAFLPYVLSIMSGNTVPSPVSWIIWACVDTLALIAMRKEGAKSGQLTGAVAGAWLITILALIFGGKPSMGATEWLSVAGAAIGIILWQRTGNAVCAIVSSQIAVFIGAFPTFARAYSNPAQEDPVAWLIWLASCVCALFAVRKWDLANALQPLTFTVVECVMVYLVVIRPYLI
ncbi:MAG: hypothetical protein V1867_00685 [Candidatus Falkowbacteria bacterium]